MAGEFRVDAEEQSELNRRHDRPADRQSGLKIRFNTPQEAEIQSKQVLDLTIDTIKSQLPDINNPLEIGQAVLEFALDKNPYTAIGRRMIGQGLKGVSSTVKRLTSGQQKLLRHLTPEAIAEISDPSLKMMYEKVAKMLHTPGLSTRNAQAVLQTGPNSGLIKALEGVDNPEVMDSVITSYFTRNPLYFSGGYGFNLDHLVPLSSTAKLATKVKPAVFQEALALQLKKFGRSFGHDQEFSLIPRRTHAAKHTGTPEIGDLSPDWKTKYLDEIIDSVPENASVEQVNEALSQMYDKSLYHTGQALQSKEFFSIREGVLESLPSRVRKALGPNFDITGRTADPVKWKLFLGHLRQAPGEVKQAIREISQVRTLELKDVKNFK